MQKYQTEIEQYGQSTLVVPIPMKIADDLLAEGHRRIIVHIDGQQFHCAIHHRKARGYFVYFGKQASRQLGIYKGEKIEVGIEADRSRYQAPLPEEFEAVISTDADAMEAFESLPPGKKRSLLFSVHRLKNVDSRIDKSLRICENLKIGFTDLNRLQK